jgi:hypothetical protein
LVSDLNFGNATHIYVQDNLLMNVDLVLFGIKGFVVVVDLVSVLFFVNESPKVSFCLQYYYLLTNQHQFIRRAKG